MVSFYTFFALARNLVSEFIETQIAFTELGMEMMGIKNDMRFVKGWINFI